MIKQARKVISNALAHRCSAFQRNTVLRTIDISNKNECFPEVVQVSTMTKPLIIDFMPWCYVLMNQ